MYFYDTFNLIPTLLIIIGHMSYSDASNVTYPVRISGDTGVDAILSLLGALLPPADDAREEPRVLIAGGMGSSTVPLTGILAFHTVTGTEHEAGDGVGAAAFALNPVHKGDFYFLKCFRFHAPKP